MKRFTFIFALLLSTVSMLAEEFTFGKLNFKTLSDTEIELVGADNGITNLDLNSPITYQGKSYSVTRIGWGAFHNCSSLTSITIPESVTSIGDFAFDGCSSLTSITIPNSVTRIGWGMFGNCSSLTSITIPNSVTSIGNWAFSYCSSLTSITIPNSVTSIGEAAFYGTALYNEKSNWENSVLYISNCLIEAKDDISGAYIIKEGTRLIANDAFWDCKSLTSITIPNSVTAIGFGMFQGCSRLRSITIPNSVTSIGKFAFYECSSLKSVSVPRHTKVDSSTFPEHTKVYRK
jgi:hypothetical protein